MSMPPQLPGIDPVLYDKSEAARYLRTTERHIERLVELGVLGYCRVGRYVMFKKGDLDDYVARTHVEPKAEI
jgi:excisionase family DNA binding protein